MKAKKNAKPGRKPLGFVRFHILVDPEVLAVIDTMAKAECRDRTAQIRYLLRKSLIDAGQIQAS